ncbi:MAG: ABC transporter permease [Candidatus Nanopelagicales bacterium]
MAVPKVPAVPPPLPRPDIDVAALVRDHNLLRSTARQPLGPYLAEVWRRRDFIWALASGRNSAEYQDTVLGRAWQVLSPILSALVYYLVFGVLLDTRRGVENFPAFLIIGVFTFTYTQRCVTGGTKAIANNRQLIRAIQFPRAVLPLAVVIEEIQQQVVSTLILFAIVLLTGEHITFWWLAVVPILALQTLFNAGLTLLVARWTAASADVTQLIPFLMRTWRYFSGMFYSIAVFTADSPHWVREAMYANPAAAFMELMRSALMTSFSAPPRLMTYATLWAVFMAVAGIWVFHRAEESYSRG